MGLLLPNEKTLIDPTENVGQQAGLAQLYFSYS